MADSGYMAAESDEEYVDSQDWLVQISELEAVNKKKTEVIKSKEEIIKLQRRDMSILEKKVEGDMWIDITNRRSLWKKSKGVGARGDCKKKRTSTDYCNERRMHR